MDYDQLLCSIMVLSTTVDSVNLSNNVPELRTLQDGLSALQDILFCRGRLSDPQIRPFYILCSSGCDALNNALLECPQGFGNVVVLGHNIRQISTRLLELFHALNTFLNLGFCMCAKILGTRTYDLCMACVARSMHSLGDYNAHLRSLEATMPVITQGCYAATCLEVFQNNFRHLGITSPSQSFCECISLGSNRSIQYPDDICIIRSGDAALNHFSEIGERLLKEVSRKDGSAEQGGLEEIKARFKEVENRFQKALQCLGPGETLVSYETLTRGYHLDFTGLTEG
ncbi:hypothetical protein BDV06DRAFT_206858 [Aspergillus oleicola]